MTPTISVALCTHNRADLLRLALESLRGQTLPRSQFEVLIVDNNSTDHTSDVADEFASDEGTRYIFEPQMGLSHARNRAWREARGRYVAYLDDDAKAPPDWLKVASGIIEAKSPAIFGGPSRAFYVSKKPKWFKDEYAQHSLGDTARPLKESEYLFGFNMFFRRDAFAIFGGFDPNLGMIGAKIAYGEETAVQYRLRREAPNEVIYYAPDVYVYHLAAPDKMVLSKLVRRRFAGGRYYQRTLGQEVSKTSGVATFKMALYLMYNLTAESTYRMLARSRDRYPHPQTYFYERALHYVGRLGRMFEQCFGKPPRDA